MPHPSMPDLNPAVAANYPDTRVPGIAGVFRFDEIFAGREGTLFQTSSVRTYVRKFRIVTKDGPAATADELDETDILKDRRCPRPWASFFSNWNGRDQGESGVTNQLADLDALAVEHHVAREKEDGTESWILTVRYSTDVGPSGPDYRIMFGGVQLGENLTNPNSPQFKPWYQKPVYEWGSAESTVARQYDLTGKPFLNSAGQPFAPAPTVEEAYPVLTIVRNEESWTPEGFTYWAYAVNNATFMNHGVDRVQILPPTAKVEWHGRTKYYRTTWRLRFKPPTDTALNVRDQGTGLLVATPASWQTQLLDCGFYQKVTGLVGPAGPRDIVPIYRHGHRISNQPALLDGLGRELGAGVAPVYLQYVTRKRRDFTTLFNATLVP